MCTHLDTWSTGEPLRVTDHAHVVCILLQLGTVTAVETRQTHLFTFDPIASMATGKSLLTHLLSPAHALGIRAHIANRMEGSVTVGTTETTCTLAST